MCILIKHDEENPGKPACLLRDSGRARFWPAEGSDPFRLLQHAYYMNS